jgi:thiol:disulfide interchange protein DsbA
MRLLPMRLLPSRLLPKFLLAATLSLAGMLSVAQAQSLPGLSEGTHYRYIEDGQPYRPQPGKVEIAEVFAYGCPHCAKLAPMLEPWKRTLPKNVQLVLVPGVFGPDDAYARVFFAAEASGALPLLHPRLFAAIHDTGSLARNADVAQLGTFVQGVQGVNQASFAAALRNEAVLQGKLKHAYDFAGRSQIEGTPSLVVAGKYRVLGDSYQGLLDNARKVAVAVAATSKPPAAKPPAAKQTSAR